MREFLKVLNTSVDWQNLQDWPMYLPSDIVLASASIKISTESPGLISTIYSISLGIPNRPSESIFLVIAIFLIETTPITKIKSNKIEAFIIIP
ncbi:MULTISPECIES: hypothetical protein [unclassified Paenibacillus]|uniref:hypothetical protein n=1 Tax=unclassified Paenibacillus TaxID=185978 RepID=UPI00384FC575